MASDVTLLARQPIFTREMEVYGYELLYRAQEESGAEALDGDRASSHVLLNAFTELSIDDVVNDKKAFINFNEELLNTELPFDGQRLVIEVLPMQSVSQELIGNLARLRGRGHLIALDNFLLTDETAKLIPNVDIVKLDIRVLSRSQQRQHIVKLKEKVLLLADKVETHDEFGYCKAMGFNLFQGYFLSKPNLIKGNKSSDSKHSVMKLLSQLSSENADFKEIEKLISHDPLLSYKLLRLINSAAYQFVQRVESLQQAISLLGFEQLRGWAYLLVLSSVDGKSNELTTVALTRARLCERIGLVIAGEGAEGCYFTAGLLSCVGAFLDEPLDVIVEKLSLSSELNAALLCGEGPVGLVLKTVKLFELGKWDEIDWSALEQYGITEAQHGKGAHLLAVEYRYALKWVSSMKSES